MASHPKRIKLSEETDSETKWPSSKHLQELWVNCINDKQFQHPVVVQFIVRNFYGSLVKILQKAFDNNLRWIFDKLNDMGHHPTINDTNKVGQEYMKSIVNNLGLNCVIDKPMTDEDMMAYDKFSNGLTVTHLERLADRLENKDDFEGIFEFLSVINNLMNIALKAK